MVLYFDVQYRCPDVPVSIARPETQVPAIILEMVGQLCDRDSLVMSELVLFSDGHSGLEK